MKVTRTWVGDDPQKKCGGTAPKVIVGPPKPGPEHPSIVKKAVRLRREMIAWAKAGLPLAPRQVRKERFAICSACSYYNPKGNWGLGACAYPGCGCTRAKLALATSQCPHAPPKWNKLA